MNPEQTVTIDQIRRMAVVRQGLHQRPGKPDRATLLNITRRIGLLQLDSVSVTARSHYLVMLSRAGLYSIDDLDSLLTDGHLFEQWAHAACLIPIEHYPYFHQSIALRRDERGGYFQGMGDDPEATIKAVLDEIRERGPLSSKDFESPRNGESGWWNWKLAKVALEYLFMYGHLMTSHRVNFHRYYDLTERVLADKNVALDKTRDDWHEWAVTAGLRQQGIGTVADIADYYRLLKRTTQQVLDTLVERGTVIPLRVDGWRTPVYIHREDTGLLAEITAGEHQPQLTTFLSPFDNLIWYRDRVESLFDFYYRIELYTPAPKRQYGYYVLPVLHNGLLVGRIDPKIERKDRCFVMRALHLEPGVTITDDLVRGLISATREFMAFHDCDDFTLETAADDDLKAEILRGLTM